MSEPEQAQPQVKAKDEAGSSKSAESGRRLQFKQQLAGLPYDDQVQALRPQPPMSMGSDHAVQTAGGSESSTASVKQAAAKGLSGGGGSMPHLDTIQSSFGGHDVGSVKAHVGGPAESANKSMGSTA